MSELDGTVAVVTGGSRGIGRAIAQALARAGAKVAVVGRSGESAQRAAAELPGEGHGGYACDVADPEQVNTTLGAIEAGQGPVGILVNNAGITRDNILLRMKDEEFDEVIAANLKGAFNFTRAVTRGMMKRRAGAILNITSVVGLTGNAGQANYAASKAGMVGLTKSVAKELASRGIRCNAIAPGFIETDMTAVLSDEQKDTIKSQVPLQRYGTTDEIASTVLWLTGPGATYVTGAVIPVDGGLGMGH